MRLLSTLLLAFIVSSVSAQKVTVDMDEGTDFSQLKTFQFLGWQDDSDKALNEFDKTRMREAFLAEFNSRGIEMVESGGDMAVSLYVVVTKETSTTAYTNYHGGTGYRYGRRGRGWGNGYSTTSYSENDYLQGTLVMDVFDAGSKDLIWQGVATGTVQEKPEKRDKSIPKSVKKLMKKYPVKPIK